MLAHLLIGAAAPQEPAPAHTLSAVGRSDEPNGEWEVISNFSLPLTRLKKLEPHYNSLEEIRKRLQKTMMTSPEAEGFSATDCKKLTYGSTLAT